MKKVGLIGAGGRMGLVLQNLINEALQLEISSLVFRGDNVAEAVKDCDVILDFSGPGSTAENAEICATNAKPYVVGTTGLTDVDHAALDDASRHIAVVQAGNFSLGVNLLASITEKAARILGNNFDIEISEMHHRRKLDAPSGTAIMLGEAAASGRNWSLESTACYSRDNRTEVRPEKEIGFAVLRGGSVIGDHSVTFAGHHEMMTLSHRALSRELFGEGAIVAVRFALTATAARYSMADILRDL